MLTYVTAYIATAIVFLAIDAVWLGVVARSFYAERLGGMLLDRPNFVAAAGFYLVYVIGIVVFAIAPALKGGGLWHAAGYAALFGVLAYATYDMTNYATLKNWPLSVVLVDIAWGGFLSAAAASAGYGAAKALPVS